MKLKNLFYYKNQKLNYFSIRTKKSKVYFFLLNLLLNKNYKKLKYVKKRLFIKKLKLLLLKLLNINILYHTQINNRFLTSPKINLLKKKNYINLNINKYFSLLKILKKINHGKLCIHNNILKIKKNLLKYSKFFSSNNIRYLVIRGKKKNMFVNLYCHKNNLFFSSIGSSGLNKKSWWDKNIKQEIIKKSINSIEIPENYNFVLCYKGFLSYWKVILDSIYKQIFIIGVKFNLLLPHNGCRFSSKKNRRKQWKKEKKK